MRCLAAYAHLIGTVKADNIQERDRFFAARGVGKDCRIRTHVGFTFFNLGGKPVGLFFQAFFLGLKFRKLPVKKSCFFGVVCTAGGKKLLALIINSQYCILHVVF